jgi:hypothetical protein
MRSNNATARAFPGISLISDETGISRSNISNLDQKLIEYKAVKITHEKIKGKIRKVYTLLKLKKSLKNKVKTISTVPTIGTVPEFEPQCQTPTINYKPDSVEPDSGESKPKPSPSFVLVKFFYDHLNQGKPDGMKLKPEPSDYGMAKNKLATWDIEELKDLIEGWYFNTPEDCREYWTKGTREFRNFLSVSQVMKTYVIERKLKRRVA